MAKQVVLSPNAPKPRAGINNQAIVSQGLVFCSGQLPVNPITGKLVDGGIKARTHQCINNLEEVLKAAGSSIENVVEVNVFLLDMKDFAEMNEAYSQHWGDVKPARTCVAVKTIPGNADVEIKCIATVDNPKSRL